MSTKTDFDGVPTEELERILQERKTAETQAHRASNARRWDQLVSALQATPELLDVLTPEHGRTSCSDTDLANAGTYGGRPPRCNRCFLLDLRASGTVEDGLVMEFSISRTVD